MNDEEIEMYRKRRERHFWDIDRFKPIISTIVLLTLLFLFGCQPVSFTSGIPPPHNLTLMGNSSSIVELTQLVNTNLMDGYFGVMVLVAVFIISFMAIAAATGSVSKAFATSSFIIFLLTIPLRGMELIANEVIYVALTLVIASIAFLVQKD